MKKLVFTFATSMTLLSGIAQLEKTCYRGAFSPAPSPMWTNNWSEWDPQNKVYPAPTLTITGNITSSTTWSTGSTVLLSAQVFVKNNSVLTIQPGVTILGNKATVGAGLFITKGSQLIANGTVTAPIVFTSNQPVGQRSLGDWGGVILLGNAVGNFSAGVNNIEGLPISSDTEYGGTNNNDNSGSLKYVRIEFGGYVYQPDKEINGLTLGCVGNGTTIDYVQVSFSNDDAFEWFGGTVNCKHLVAYRCLDDDFDTDFGFSGKVQFCLGVRDPQIADNPAVSTSEGFESDNDPAGSISSPLTSAIFCNVTEIGPLRGNLTSTVASGYRRSVRIRRNSNLKIFNSILTDAATRGVYIDGLACEGNANTGALKFKHNIVAGYGQRATETGTFGIIMPNANAWIIQEGNDTLKTTTGILTTPYNYTTPDYRPAPGSIALSGASYTDAIIASITNTVPSLVLATIPSSVCIGEFTLINQPAIFVASSTISPNFCQLTWSASAGVLISNTNIPNPSFTISTVGTFSIYLSVTDANGISNLVKTITTTTCTNVSLLELKNKIGNIALAPNPSIETTELIVNSNNNSFINVCIYDITGKQVMSPIQNQNLVIGDNKFKINTSNLNNGIYFVTLFTNHGKETIKLVVNK